MTKVVFAAGGTGGHIIPALSIAAEFQNAGDKLLFIGNKGGLEETLVKAKGINFEGIKVQKLYRKLTIKHLIFPFIFLFALLKAGYIIKKFKADVVIGTGGFVSGPVCLAGFLMKIPIFIQEQNSYPGFTSRVLGKIAKKVFLGNGLATKYFSKNKYVISGNPINNSLFNNTEKIDWNKINFRKETAKLFIFGGSQGSLKINKMVLEIVDTLLAADIEIIWQTGEYSYEMVKTQTERKQGIYCFAFTDAMGKIYNSVDFAVCRAGALTIAELQEKQVPAILIPLPSAAENHQYYNALAMKEEGTGIIINQNEITTDKFKRAIFYLKENYKKMKQNFKQYAHRKAGKIIYNEIKAFLKQ